VTRIENTDYTKVGDSAFTNGNVISYEGENYYRACNYLVKTNEDGSASHCVKHVDHRNNPNSLHEDFAGNIKHHGEDPKLVGHARRELELIGEDQDVIDWYLECVRAFVAYGHSGGSAMATIPVLEKLLRHENLSELTDDPEEWYKHSAEMWDGVTGIWQNKRNTKMFSSDKGKSYWSVDDPGRKMSTHPKSFAGSNRPRSEQYGH